MPDLSRATQASIDTAVRAMEGRPLMSVNYYGFPLATPGVLPVDAAWGDVDPDDHADRFARHHYPAMGVEFSFATGGPVTACWGDAFGHFGLEVLESAAPDVFHNQPHHEDVSSHPWWASWIGSPMRVRLHWATGYADSTKPAPLVLALTSTADSLWLSAAEVHDDGRFMLGLDGVTVSPEPVPVVASVVGGA